MQVEQAIFHTELRFSPVERSRDTVLGAVYQSLTSRNRVVTSTAVRWRVGFTGRIAGQHLIIQTL